MRSKVSSKVILLQAVFDNPIVRIYSVCMYQGMKYDICSIYVCSLYTKASHAQGTESATYYAIYLVRFGMLLLLLFLRLPQAGPDFFPDWCVLLVLYYSKYFCCSVGKQNPHN